MARPRVTLDWWQTGEVEEEDRALWVTYPQDGMSPSRDSLKFTSSG
jgi:hypothetical protein